MKAHQKLIAVRLLVLSLAVICLLAGVANAGPIFQGKFTLPRAARWGLAVLPAGEYWLRLDQLNATRMITIQDAERKKEPVLIPCSIREDSGKGGSALLISSRANQSVVHSLRLSELGETFIFDPVLAHGREMVKEARNTSVVPVSMVKK